MRISVTQGGAIFLSAIINTPFSQRSVSCKPPFSWEFCRKLSPVKRTGTHINSEKIREWAVSSGFQSVQREVGRDDQRLAAAVTAVMFQPVFGALHKVVTQRIAAKAIILLLPQNQMNDKGKVRHMDGDFFLHEGFCDTARKVKFSRFPLPQNRQPILSAKHIPNASHTGGQVPVCGFLASRSQSPVPHGGVGFSVPSTVSMLLRFGGFS